MPLLVPHHMLLIPVTLCDRQMPPVIPNVNVPQVVRHAVPLVAASVINSTGVKSSVNPGRTYLYNLMVNQGFNNREFQEVVELSSQYLALNFNKGHYRSIELSVDDAVEAVLAMYLSSLIVTTPELKAVCSPQAVSGAYQNANTYQNVRNEIQNMMHNQLAYPGGVPAVNTGYHGVQQAPQPQWQPQPQYPQPGYPQQVPQYPQQGYPQQYPQQQQQYPQQQYPQQQYPQQGYSQQGYPQQQQYPQQQWQGQGGFQYQAPRVGPGFQVSPAAEAIMASRGSDEAMKSAMQGRFMGHLQRNQHPTDNPNHQYQPQQQQQTNYAPHIPAQQQDRWNTQQTAQVTKQPEYMEMPAAVPEEPKQTVGVASDPGYYEITKLKIRGGSEMERSKHAVVYFGQEITNGVKERNAAHEMASIALASASALPKEEGEPSDIEICQTIQLDTTEESLLVDAKMKYLEACNDVNERKPLFRAIGKASRPFVGRSYIKGVCESLLSATSLSRLSDKMRMKITEAIKNTSGLRNLDDVDTIAYLNTLDRDLTIRVNDFLKYNLQSSISIESFTTDTTELGPYLERKMGLKARYAWDEFSSKLINRFVDGFNPDVESTITANYEVPEGLVMVSSPMTYSFTFTELTMSELGYETEGSCNLIDTVEAPALFRIAASLTKHKKELETDTDIDYLVTADGMKYRIFKNLRGVGESYVIKLA